MLEHLRIRLLAAAGLALAICLAGIGPAAAQACGNDASGFDRWLAQYRTQAASQGISQATLASALGGIQYDSTVIRLDRGQKSFKLSFEQFYARRVSESLLKRGRQRMQQHAALLNRIEQRFGVPAPILMAIWGLETNFGSDGGGKFSIVQSIATLAYDCRRTDFFREHLNAAMRIIDRGDIPASQMRGGWAGEIGPMQFLPGSYAKFAVDFDGDGRRDLFRSVPDMLASTANFLKSHGWQARQPWGEGTANYAVYVKTISVMATKLVESGAEPAAPARERRAGSQ
jgi:lytic murein transglycosylase